MAAKRKLTDEHVHLIQMNDARGRPFHDPKELAKQLGVSVHYIYEIRSRKRERNPPETIND